MVFLLQMTVKVVGCWCRQCLHLQCSRFQKFFQISSHILLEVETVLCFQNQRWQGDQGKKKTGFVYGVEKYITTC